MTEVSERSPVDLIALARRAEVLRAEHPDFVADVETLIADFVAVHEESLESLRKLKAWEGWEAQRILAEFDECGRKRKNRKRIGPSPLEQEFWAERFGRLGTRAPSAVGEAHAPEAGE